MGIKGRSHKESERLRDEVANELMKDNSRSRVAKKLNCNIAFVSSVAVALGIPKADRCAIEPGYADTVEQLFEHGMSRKEIADKFDIEVHHLKRFCDKHGIKMTDARENPNIELIAARVEAGKKLQAVLKGEHVSKNAQRIINLNRLGFSPMTIRNRTRLSEKYIRKVIAVHGVGYGA